MLPAAFLAIGASFAYGLSDVFASRSSRQISPTALALYSQIAGVLLLIPVLAISGQNSDGSGIAWGVASGVIAAIGVLTFYRALSVGPASIVSAITASGVTVPVLFSAINGNLPSGLAWGGLVVAVLGLVLISSIGADDASETVPLCPGRGPALQHPAVDRTSDRSGPGLIPLSLLAAICFGSFFVLLDRGTESAVNSVFWVALGVSIGSIPITFAVAVFNRSTRALSIPPRNRLVSVILVGVLDVLGDVALAFATTSGQLGLVSVLASLDIAVTVVLARLILKERLLRIQFVGVTLTIIGVILISSA